MLIELVVRDFLLLLLSLLVLTKEGGITKNEFGSFSFFFLLIYLLIRDLACILLLRPEGGGGVRDEEGHGT